MGSLVPFKCQKGKMQAGPLLPLSHHHSAGLVRSIVSVSADKLLHCSVQPLTKVLNHSNLFVDSVMVNFLK